MSLPECRRPNQLQLLRELMLPSWRTAKPDAPPGPAISSTCDLHVRPAAARRLMGHCAYLE